MIAFTYISIFLWSVRTCLKDMRSYGRHDDVDAVRRVAARLSIEVREWRDKIAEMEVNRSQVMINVKEDVGKDIR